MDKSQIEKTYKCIDALAAGVDPATGESLPLDSIINRGDIVRTLFYAKNIIAQYKKRIAQEQPISLVSNQEYREESITTPKPFATRPNEITGLDSKQHERMLTPKEHHPQIQLDIADPSLTTETFDGQKPDMSLYESMNYGADRKIKEFWGLVTSYGDPALKEISYADVTAWLCDQGYMAKASGARQSKRPTDKGIDIGIFERSNPNRSGKFAAEVVYSTKAQAFIVEHLPDICAYHARTQKNNS